MRRNIRRLNIGVKILPNKKDKTYGFLASKGWLIDVDAKNVKEAYKKAVKKAKSFENTQTPSGYVTRSYLPYDKEGFAQTGVYKKFRGKIK